MTSLVVAESHACVSVQSGGDMTYCESCSRPWSAGGGGGSSGNERERESNQPPLTSELVNCGLHKGTLCIGKLETCGEEGSSTKCHPVLLSRNEVLQLFVSIFVI